MPTGQASNAGVMVGWKILKVNGESNLRDSKSIDDAISITRDKNENTIIVFAKSPHGVLKDSVSFDSALSLKSDTSKNPGGVLKDSASYDSSISSKSRTSKAYISIELPESITGNTKMIQVFPDSTYGTIKKALFEKIAFANGHQENLHDYEFYCKKLDQVLEDHVECRIQDHSWSGTFHTIQLRKHANQTTSKSPPSSSRTSLKSGNKKKVKRSSFSDRIRIKRGSKKKTSTDNENE